MDRREFMQAGIATIALSGMSGVEAYSKPFGAIASEEKGFAPVTCENVEASDADLRVRFLGTGAAGWKDGSHSILVRVLFGYDLIIRWRIR